MDALPSQRITEENARTWFDKRLHDAETAQQRGMFEIAAEWRADAARIAEQFGIVA